MRRGVHSMSPEAPTLSYLQGRTPREAFVQACGPEYVDREPKAIDEDGAGCIGAKSPSYRLTVILCERPSLSVNENLTGPS